MNKIKYNKLIIILMIILFSMIIFPNSVNATENITKVQNVKYSYLDDGSLLVTWDNVNGGNYIMGHIFKYYNREGTFSYQGNANTVGNSAKLFLPNYYLGRECVIQVKVGGLDYSDPVTINYKFCKVKNLETNTVSDSTISLSWTKLVNAQKYEIYLYNNTTGKYEYNSSTTNTNIYEMENYEIKNLKPATEYKIKVRAVTEANGKTFYGDFSDELKTMTAPGKVKGLKTSLTKDGVKLQWDKVSGASGYIIYYTSVKDGEFVKIATIDKNINNYTYRYLTSGTRYYYKVQAFKNYNNQELMAPFSNSITQVYVKAPSISVKSYNDKATIKWDRVLSASGYEIYRATSKNGKYEKIKTITKGKTTSYTDKKINSKKVYYYKVKAYQTRSGKKYYSAYSSAKEKTKYAQVEITNTTYNSSKKSNTLKWKKVSGVTGYKIYRATSKNGTYKHIKTISKNSTTTYTDKKSIGVGNLYYYKIRAYKKNGTKTDYGQYSSAKKRTTGTRQQQMNKIKLKPIQAGYSEYEKIVKKVTKGKKTVYDKVKAIYKYVVENMSHDDYHCKHFSGTFEYLLYVLGIENVYCVRGKTTTVSGGWTAHTWVIVEINDTRYVFDPSIDRHTLERTGKINYGRFFKTEKEVEKSYNVEYYYSDGWPVSLST